MPKVILPTTGTATYEGTVSGTFTNQRMVNGRWAEENSGSFTGTVSYTPDFAHDNSSGDFSDLVDTSTPTPQPVKSLTGEEIHGVGDPGYIDRNASPPTLSGIDPGNVIVLGNGNSEVIWRSVNAKFGGDRAQNLSGDMQATFHEWSADPSPHSTDVMTTLEGKFKAKNKQA